MINKSKIMKYSHVLTKIIKGCYPAKMSMALKIVWGLVNRKTGAFQCVKEKLISTFLKGVELVNKLSNEVEKGKIYLSSKLTCTKSDLKISELNLIKGVF